MISWKPSNRPTSPLSPGKPVLQFGLPIVGPSEAIPFLSCPIINMKRICDVPSGMIDSPSHLHHAHSSVTLTHNSSGLGRTFSAISVTAIRGEKRNKEWGWRSRCSNAIGCRPRGILWHTLYTRPSEKCSLFCTSLQRFNEIIICG